MSRPTRIFEHSARGVDGRRVNGLLDHRGTRRYRVGGLGHPLLVAGRGQRRTGSARRDRAVGSGGRAAVARVRLPLQAASPRGVPESPASRTRCADAVPRSIESPPRPAQGARSALRARFDTSRARGASHRARRRGAGRCVRSPAGRGSSAGTARPCNLSSLRWEVHLRVDSTMTGPNGGSPD